MVRFVAFDAIFFLLPFAAYALWLIVTRRHAAQRRRLAGADHRLSGARRRGPDDRGARRLHPLRHRARRAAPTCRRTSRTARSFPATSSRRRQQLSRSVGQARPWSGPRVIRSTSAGFWNGRRPMCSLERILRVDLLQFAPDLPRLVDLAEVAERGGEEGARQVGVRGPADPLPEERGRRLVLAGESDRRCRGSAGTAALKPGSRRMARSMCGIAASGLPR